MQRYFSHKGRTFSLKHIMPQWLTGPQLTGSSGAGIKHRHRPAVPEGCGCWSCGTASHGFLCVPTDPGHLEVLHGAHSKNCCNNNPPQLHTTKPQGWQIPYLHSRKCPLESHVQLFALLCAQYRTLTRAVFLTLFITEWLGLTESICGLYSLVTL